MYVRLVSLALVAPLSSIAYPSSALAGSRPEKEARFAEKVKTAIAKLGTGPDARVEVKLSDKTKLRGYVNEVADQYFVVVDEKTGSATTVTSPGQTSQR